jgi:hypothetical protein
MPTEGGNPDNVKGSAMGHQFARADQLDFSLNCSLQQTNNQIELKTDMFGTFTGTISWSAETVELGPLTIDDDFDPAPWCRIRILTGAACAKEIKRKEGVYR